MLTDRRKPQYLGDDLCSLQRTGRSSNLALGEQHVAQPVDISQSNLIISEIGAHMHFHGIEGVMCV